MKISLLVHNLSGNNLVRVYPIARTLERFAEIEILGFVGPGGVFPPYRDEFDYISVPAAPFPGVVSRARELRRRITGDVLYAFKPNPLSLGVGLWDRRESGRPLVLDVEDFDLAFQYLRGRRLRFKNSLLLWQPDSFTWLRLADRLARRADRVTVVSTFLRDRYGGTLLPHGADTNVFDPSRFDREDLKRRWGTEGCRTILFAGKLTAHKGMDEVVEILRGLDLPAGQPPVKLLLVGGQPHDPPVRRLREAAPDRTIHIPSQPHAKMPEILAQADLVVLPQRDTLFTRAQIPGKVYEAMAMAKPIVATAVSDLPLILEGAGVVVPPGDAGALRQAVQGLLRDPARAEQLGRNARERCVRDYSWDAMERTLRGTFEGLGP